MQFHPTKTFIGLILVAAFLGAAQLFASHQQAATTPCCGQAAATDTAKQPDQTGKEKSTEACPLYPYMNFGSYCSYYALIRDTCTPVSYDSTDCSLPAGDCHTGVNCKPTKGLRGDHPGQDGYQGVLRARQSTFPPAPSGAPVTVDPIDHFVIKFNVRPRTPIYAQVFIAKVTPTMGPNQNPGILARAIEITEESAGELRYDFSSMSPGADPITRKPGQGHYLVFHHGAMDIDIITNHRTPGHGQ